MHLYASPRERKRDPPGANTKLERPAVPRQFNEKINDRIDDLGGEPLDYEVGSGKGQASLWGKITGMRDDSSVAGMRIGAERSRAVAAERAA